MEHGGAGGSRVLPGPAVISVRPSRLSGGRWRDGRGLQAIGRRIVGDSGQRLGDFRVAMAVQYLVGGVGLIGILRTRRLARQKLAEDGVVVRPLREVLAERRGLALSGSVKSRGLESEAPSDAEQRRT